MTPAATSPELGLASRLLDGATALPDDLHAAATLNLAWALQAESYESWSTAPARAARAAEWLGLLAARVPPQLQVSVLADWTAGIAAITQGRLGEAVQHLDRARTGLLQAGQPDPAAQSQVPKVMVLSLLGRHDEATACAQAKQRELLALGNCSAAARVSLNLGNLQFRRDHYCEAVQHFRQAVVLFARQGDHEHSVLADIGLADALTSLGDTVEALRIHARARMRAAHQKLELPQALVDESVALLDLARGQYRQALAGLESARRRYAALAMPQYLAISEKQLADAYLALRLLPEALALFDAAIAQFQALDLPDEQAWALTQRGRTLAVLRPAQADATFAEAATLFAAQGNAVGAAAVALARPGQDPARLDLVALQAALQPGDALVEYGTVDDELLACVVTPQRVDLVRRMASWTEVETGVRGLRFQIETLRHGAKPLRRHVAQLAARATARLSTLHQQLWAPLAPVWEATAGPQRVLVVPHGLLGAQPFAALDDAAVALGQRCQLALAPSARAVLRGLLWPSVAAQRILALGESSRLPQASAEAQAVELAKTLALKAATVVLSACETGLTDSQAASGDEMVGLVRAFWVAGAARVLASQWPVDDAGTAAVMAGFYRALVGGAGPVAVLQVAQTQTRQRHPHPYFWAAFSRFGGW